MSANPEAAAKIKEFKGIEDELFTAQATLQLILDWKDVIKEWRTVDKPLGIGDRTQQGFNELPNSADEKCKHRIKYKEYLAEYRDIFEKACDGKASQPNEHSRQKT